MRLRSTRLMRIDLKRNFEQKSQNYIFETSVVSSRTIKHFQNKFEMKFKTVFVASHSKDHV